MSLSEMKWNFELGLEVISQEIPNSCTRELHVQEHKKPYHFCDVG